jgi:hypothetical protein
MLNTVRRSLACVTPFEGPKSVPMTPARSLSAYQCGEISSWTSIPSHINQRKEMAGGGWIPPGHLGPEVVEGYNLDCGRHLEVTFQIIAKKEIGGSMINWTEDSVRDLRVEANGEKEKARWRR